MIVYVDVLIALNFVVNYLLLAVSARMCGERAPTGRVLLAAAVGGVSSLVIFLPELPGLVNVALKILLCALTAAISGGFRTPRGYLKRLFMLLAASFVLAGLMLLVTLLPGGESAFYYNGVCYFHVSALLVLGCAAAAWCLITLFERLFKKSVVGAGRYQVEITAAGKSKRLTGVMDSQNNLIDLFTGTPVVLGGMGALFDIAPSGVLAAAAKILTDETPDTPGVRLILCDTVSGGGLLPIFRPQYMALIGPDGVRREIGDVYIALAPRYGGGDTLLLNPVLTGEPIRNKTKAVL